MNTGKNDTNCADDEEVLDINDLRVPEAIRAHSQRFCNPARFVADLGHGEYVLFAKDGELLDLVYLK